LQLSPNAHALEPKTGCGLYSGLSPKEECVIKSKFAAVALIGAAIFLAFPASVFAYIDPGTGSYLLQILLAGLFGGLLFLRIFWKKVKAFFTRLFAKKQK
jgi:hypothetical protein